MEICRHWRPRCPGKASLSLLLRGCFSTRSNLRGNIKNRDTPPGYPLFWCRCPVAVPGIFLADGAAALLLPPVWGARYLPCRRCGCVSYRPRHTLMLRFICHWQRGATWPRPLVRLPPSATGSGRLTPRNLTCGSIQRHSKIRDTPMGYPLFWCR